MFEFLKQSRTVLGMNARNLLYVRPYNPARSKRFADEKLLSKKVLQKNSLPVSRLIATIKTKDDLARFDWATLPESFALKPNRGFGGEGIVVVYARKKGRDDAWVKADGSIVTVADLTSHIENILDGSFSLSNTPDIAFFEERLKLLKLFKPYTWKGIPDIRVIVFNKVPVMAMLRLPTEESGGKANLQQGAIGVGIDMMSGTTTTAILGKGRLIETIPGTRLLLSGLRIPEWRNILTMAVRAQEISGLGFLGADIAIDRDQGPVILELNARPGLSIQLANMDGLARRLERVQGLKIKNVDHGVRVGMNLFGGEIEEEIEGLSGKRIIGTVAKVKIIGKDGKEVEVEAKIDTGADSSSIDLELARKLGFEKTVEEYSKLENDWEKLSHLSNEDRQALFAHVPDIVDTVAVVSSHGSTFRVRIPVTLVLEGITLNVTVNLIERSHLTHPLLIGKKNLGPFLINVSR